MSPQKTPEPTELIYVPNSTWAPVLVAAGIALLAVSAFRGWVVWVVGAFVLYLGVRSWWRESNDEISRMRRQQRTDTAVLPAEPIRRR